MAASNMLQSKKEATSSEKFVSFAQVNVSAYRPKYGACKTLRGAKISLT
jgi:hypothetical protein